MPSASPTPAERRRYARTHGAKDRLLRRLVASRGRIVADEALLFAMYAPEHGPDPADWPASAAKNLKVLLYRLRQELPPRSLRRVRDQGYVLHPLAVPDHLADDVDRAAVVLARSEADVEALWAIRRARRPVPLPSHALPAQAAP